MRKACCEICLQKYETRKCPEQGATTCTNCKQEGHTALDWKCKAVKRKKAKLKRIRQINSGRYRQKLLTTYEVERSEPESPRARPEAENEGFTEVTSRKGAKKRAINKVSPEVKKKPERPKRVLVPVVKKGNI